MKYFKSNNKNLRQEKTSSIQSYPRYKTAKNLRLFKGTGTAGTVKGRRNSYRKRFRFSLKNYGRIKYFIFRIFKKKDWLTSFDTTTPYYRIQLMNLYSIFKKLFKIYASAILRFFTNQNRIFILHQANQRFGLHNIGRAMALPGYVFRKRLPQRHKIDNLFKDIVNRNMRRKHESELDYFHYKNNFWVRDPQRRQLLNLMWKKYRYFRGWRPYSYINKKYKMYFNWGDYHLFSRFPIYRRKYNIFYNYPLFANYLFLHKNQIKEQHLFRWLFRLKYKQLVRKFKKSVAGTKRAFEMMFLNFFEMRMDVLIYRLNFAFSIKQAKQ